MQRSEQFFDQQRVKVLMAVPQHHQHDQLQLVQSEIFLFQGNRAVYGHFTFDRGNQVLLLGKQQELARFIADELQFQLGEMTLPGMLETCGIAVGILLLQRGQPGQRFADLIAFKTGG